jgi:molecular chaperone GrpE
LFLYQPEVNSGFFLPIFRSNWHYPLIKTAQIAIYSVANDAPHFTAFSRISILKMPPPSPFAGLNCFFSQTTMTENQKPEENQAPKASFSEGSGPAPVAPPGTPADASPEEIEAALAANEAESADALSAALAEVATLKAKASELHDQNLRAAAEVQNIRRRSEDDVSKARKYAVESFAESLLPVMDSLTAGLAIQNATNEQLREGAEATLRQLKSALERNKVLEINPAQGDKLDPAKHQAIQVVPAPEGSEQDANTIVAVLQKGYTISERTLRPALVTVAAPKN